MVLATNSKNAPWCEREPGTLVYVLLQGTGLRNAIGEILRVSFEAKKTMRASERQSMHRTSAGGIPLIQIKVAQEMQV